MNACHYDDLRSIVKMIFNICYIYYIMLFISFSIIPRDVIVLHPILIYYENVMEL